MAQEKSIKKSRKTIDIRLVWVLELDKDLEDWRALAEEWLKTQVRGKQTALSGLSSFFQEYLINHSITRRPKDFLTRGYVAPDFYEISYVHLKSQQNAIKKANKLVAFIDWILNEKYSIEDDFGNRMILAEFHNPLTKCLPDFNNSTSLDESNKNVLPYRYIKDLRTILCPAGAVHFNDWKFAQESTDISGNGGDWFIVDKSIIDENDPDCVYRKRESTKYGRETKGLPYEVYELWSPAVSTALLTKLLLPLRTYQVRMVDSGEMDTYKYVQPERNESGQWVENDSPLKKGNEHNPVENGVLRKFTDPTTKLVMTGFYINTNKTADINSEETKKGYDIPWQYEEVQYWLAKLRDWQQKYNPVDKPTPWVDLKKNHLGQIKDNKILKKWARRLSFSETQLLRKKNIYQ